MTTLVRRSEWGARPPKSRTALDEGNIKGVGAHYNGGSPINLPSHSSCAQHMRNVQNFHMNTRRWVDFAYSFGICPHGFVYEGRGWGTRTAANGTNYGNAHYHAIYFMLGGDQEPTKDAKTAFNWLVSGHTDVGFGGAVRPHSFFKATGCPGNPVRAWIAAGRPAVEGDTALQRGMRGQEVRNWQAFLLEWNEQALPQFGADGDFGAETEKWTKKFQASMGVTQDGVVGPATREAQEKFMAGEQANDFDNVVVYDRKAHWIDQRLALAVGSYRNWKVLEVSDAKGKRIGHLHAVGLAANTVDRQGITTFTPLSGATRNETLDSVTGWMVENRPDQ